MTLDVDVLWDVLSGMGIIDSGTWVSFRRQDAEDIAAAYADALRVLPDSDAPTPREATLREALEQYGEHQHEWVPAPSRRFTDGAWRDAVEPEEGWDQMGVRRMCPDEDTGECWCGLRAALQAAASTAAAGEGATGDADAAWEALREAIRWHRGSLGDADPLIEHRPLIEAAIRDAVLRAVEPSSLGKAFAAADTTLRATSETPRETPLAGPLDVTVLALALSSYGDGDRRRPSQTLMAELVEEATRLAAEYATLLAARGSE